MLSKYINSTSGRKYLTENGSSHINFLHKNFKAPRRQNFAYFGNFSLRLRSFDRITTSGLKSYVLPDSHRFV